MNSGRPETMGNLPALYTIFQGEVAKSQTMEPLSKFQAVGSKVWLNSHVILLLRTGKDLDPNNVIIEQEERQRRSFQDYTGQKITFEAVLNTAFKKCGCKGYFAKDYFMQPGGAKYSPMRKRRRKRQSQQSLKSLTPREILLEKERRKINIETGSHLTLTAQTLRVIQARGQGRHQRTASQQRRRQRRRGPR
ncbi:hypothetical protein Celaphus_00012465, partial [Cervus elaphus hippelaphus]